MCIEELIPELKESEDERIRKALITYFSDEDESYDGIPYPNIRAWLEKQGEQKPAWSKEDEWKFSDILALLRGGENCHYNNPDLFNWLKNLKDRVQSQPKQEWSDYDECMLTNLIDDPNCSIDSEYVHWFKSLKDRYAWTPSDEQMDVLLSEVSAWTKGCHKQIILESLYNDLKKLKE